MLRCCEECVDRKTLSYEDLVPVCGKCKLAKKADMVEHAEKYDPFGKNRWTGGTTSKITEEQRKSILKLYNNGSTQQQIAEIFGYSQGTISNVIRKEKRKRGE